MMTSQKNSYERSIDTLVADVYHLIVSGSRDISDKAYEELGRQVANAVKYQLVKTAQANIPLNSEALDFSPPLRMSNVGRPDRYLWYLMKAHENAKAKGVPLPQHLKEDFSPSKIFSFMYGAILEEVLVWLAEQSGHTVEDRQKEVEVEGILGHMDCRIDGVGLDVKSASNQSFTKFRNKKILTDDPFGYMHQLGGYFKDEPETAHFVANKETGELTLARYKKEQVPDTAAVIRRVQALIGITGQLS